MDFTVFIAVVPGWISGFFINYASDVLPVTRRFSRPDCRNCQNEITWIDYLLLRRCTSCGIARSGRTWIVQALSTAAFVYFWLNTPKVFTVLGLPLSLIVFVYFAVITVIDLEHRLILFPTSIFGAALGLVVGTLIYKQSSGASLVSALISSLLGGVIGFGVMYLLYQFGTLVARVRAKRLTAAGQADDEEEALGGGDVYLAGVLGLMLGSRFIINGLAYGIILGGLASILFLIVMRLRGAGQALMTFIPYGPYLIAGAFIVLFLG